MRFYFLAAFVFLVASTVSGAPTKTSTSIPRSTATLGPGANDHTYALAARQVVDENIQLEARAFRGREHEHGYRPQHYTRDIRNSTNLIGKKVLPKVNARSHYDGFRGAGGRGTQSHRRFKSRPYRERALDEAEEFYRLSTTPKFKRPVMIEERFVDEEFEG